MGTDGTVVTDTDKIISKIKFILSCICIINFCKWPKTSVYHGAIIQWCKHPILSTMYRHYPELENKLTYYITIIINL